MVYGKKKPLVVTPKSLALPYYIIVASVHGVLFISTDNS